MEMAMGGEEILMLNSEQRTGLTKFFGVPDRWSEVTLQQGGELWSDAFCGRFLQEY